MPGSGTHCPSCLAELEDSPETCPKCGHSFAVVVQGSVISGRYEVLSRLGKGGMGLVYLARDRMLDTDVALKVLRSDLSAGLERRFRSEIRLARQVRHRNVCGIHEYGEDGSLHYIVMEYIQGSDLHTSIRDGHGLPPEEAFDVAMQATEGLQAIHEAGIIHRDLKTANIMRDRRGHIRLMDFGIAKQAEADGAPGLTGTGQIIGTPDYMSPEQIRSEKLDFRSDIYAMGAVIFELFTGRTPFRGSTPVAIIMKHLEEPPPLKGPEAAGIPEPLLPVLEQALAKDREARHPTAGALLADLHRAREAWRGVERPALERSPALAPQISTAPAAAVAFRPVTEPAAPLTPVPSVTLPSPSPARVTARAPTLVPPRVSAVRPRVETRAPKPSGPPLRWMLIAVPLLVVAFAAPLIVIFSRRPSPGGNDGRGAASSPVPPAASPTAVSSPAARTPATTLATMPGKPPAAPPVTARTPALSADDLAALDRLSAEEPEKAFARASEWQRQYPNDSTLTARVGRYRNAWAQSLAERGRDSLTRAEATKAIDLYDGAVSAFSKALELDPANAVARDGLAAAIRAGEKAKVMMAGATFVEGETEFKPPPPPAAPPGLGEAPPGFAIKPAEPPAPQARLLIELEPRQLKTGDEFQVRYSIYNVSAAPLSVAEVTIQNVVGDRGAAGGSIVPRARGVAPGAKVLLLETRDTWKYDVSTAWRTTIRVVLSDGSAYTNTLHSRR